MLTLLPWGIQIVVFCCCDMVLKNISTKRDNFYNGGHIKCHLLQNIGTLPQSTQGVWMEVQGMDGLLYSGGITDYM